MIDYREFHTMLNDAADINGVVTDVPRVQIACDMLIDTGDESDFAELVVKFIRCTEHCTSRGMYVWQGNADQYKFISRSGICVCLPIPGMEGKIIRMWASDTSIGKTWWTAFKKRDEIAFLRRWYDDVIENDNYENGR